MGAYLSKPNTDVARESGVGTTLRYGTACMQGWRVNQEDAHNCIIDSSDRGASIFAVYDGHGGSEVSKYMADNFPQFLMQHKEFEEGRIGSALEKAFIAFDSTLTSEEVKAELKKLREEMDGGDEGVENGHAVEEVGSEDEQEERKLLFEEADLPLEQVLERYGLQKPETKVKNDVDASGSQEQDDEGDDDDSSRARRRSNRKRLKTSPVKCNSSETCDPDAGSSAPSAPTNRPTTPTKSPTPKRLKSSTSPPTLPDSLDFDTLQAQVIALEDGAAVALDFRTHLKQHADKDGVHELWYRVGRWHYAGGRDLDAADALFEGRSHADAIAFLRDDLRLSGADASRDAILKAMQQQTTVPVRKLEVVKGTEGDDSEESDDEDFGEEQAKQRDGEGEEGSDEGEEESGEDEESDSDDEEGELTEEQMRLHRLHAFAAMIRGEEMIEIVSTDEEDSDESEEEEGSSDGEVAGDFDDQLDRELLKIEKDEKREKRRNRTVVPTSAAALKDHLLQRFLRGGGAAEDEDGEDGSGADSDAPGIGSGTTACFVVVKKGVLYVANAGDSRAVLCRDGKAVDLSVDHKPEDDVELARITKAGGKVSEDGRVNNGLNLSRAIGDHLYKRNDTLPLEEQMISALPDIRVEQLTADDRFMVVACDGIWNSLTSQEVCDFVQERLRSSIPEKAHLRLERISEELCKHCLADNTLGDGTGCDNMTVVIVEFTETGELKKEENGHQLNGH